MYLAHVEVRNFRCLRELDIELRSGLNVLVGRNNLGKTSLLAAIRHALGSAATRQEPLWLSEDDFFRDLGGVRAEELSVLLTFRELTDAERVFFYEIVDFDPVNIEASPAIIRFQANWDDARQRAMISRTGGPSSPGAPDVPSQILAALSVTFLTAVRDAEVHLAPGPRSRLALMLRDLARRRGGGSAESIEGIFARANQALELEPLISEAQASLKSTTRTIAGSDYMEPAIRASSVDFERILRTLQVQVPGAPVDGLHANGLGYNNLLYMAVVLEHLRMPFETECPLLMVEEPEAHLHPQVTALLAEYLSFNNPAGNAPQTIVSTHSPTLVAAVPSDRVHVFFTERAAPGETPRVRCNSLSRVGLSGREAGAVRRMMDVTRASMYFAKALILVEGVCEALLLPALAKRLGRDFAKHHVAVVPLCGVAFETFKKLLGPDAFGVDTAIVTDADPPIPRKSNTPWDELLPEETGGEFTLSARTSKLRESFEGHATVRVYNSKLTLEYDLAEAGDANALHVADAWERCFEGNPRTLTRAMVQDSGVSRRDKALIVWRGVCLASSTGSKAELAQHLTNMLADPAACPGFVVPDYLKAAIEYVCPAEAPQSPPAANAISNA